MWESRRLEMIPSIRPLSCRLLSRAATAKVSTNPLKYNLASAQRIVQLRQYQSSTKVLDAASGDGAAAAGKVSLSSPKLDELFAEITRLPEEEVNILGALVIQILGRNIYPGEFGRGLDGVVLAGPADGESEEVEEKAVKTLFAVKLVGFDDKAKIKVIKEVRAIAGLGLKEAKDLVESAPKVIMKDLSSEKADEMKAQLEAIGAKIEID